VGWTWPVKSTQRSQWCSSTVTVTVTVLESVETWPNTTQWCLLPLQSLRSHCTRARSPCYLLTASLNPEISPHPLDIIIIYHDILAVVVSTLMFKKVDNRKSFFLCSKIRNLGVTYLREHLLIRKKQWQKTSTKNPPIQNKGSKLKGGFIEGIFLVGIILIPMSRFRSNHSISDRELFEIPIVFEDFRAVSPMNR